IEKENFSRTAVKRVIAVAGRFHQVTLLVVFVLDLRRPALTRNRLRGQPSIRIVESARVDHGPGCLIASRDLHQPWPVPGEIEPRTLDIQLPRVRHATLIVVVEFEKMNPVPCERMEIFVPRKSDRGALSGKSIS